MFGSGNALVLLYGPSIPIFPLSVSALQLYTAGNVDDSPISAKPIIGRSLEIEVGEGLTLTTVQDGSVVHDRTEPIPIKAVPLLDFPILCSINRSATLVLPQKSIQSSIHN